MNKLSPSKPHEITELLEQWSGGNQAALDQLYPLVYEELRRLARSYMRREPKGHTLQTTALINEAYVRLVDQHSVRWQNRSHFFAISAQIMRRILVDHARAKLTDKRGGGAKRVELGDVPASIPDEQLLAIRDALERLTSSKPDHAQLVELRFFAGLTLEEAAECLDISLSTADRAWRYARAWLYTAMSGEQSENRSEKK